ncbi:MAG: HEPN domain-containing protein [Coriobacteriales bacterium]|jgi:HEPN domain-containing protein|nr:HEPN domain-containing protein [Coriobacteriales bacterium]
MDDLSDEQSTFLDSLNSLYLESRYPEYKKEIAETLTQERCKKFLKDTEALLCWIKTK